MINEQQIFKETYEKIESLYNLINKNKIGVSASKLAYFLYLKGQLEGLSCYLNNDDTNIFLDSLKKKYNPLTDKIINSMNKPKIHIR